MIALYLYLIFCYGFLSGLDDGEKWTWQDYLLLLFSPVIVPVVIGVWLGEKIRNTKNDKS